jgi:hypothetical protein
VRNLLLAAALMAISVTGVMAEGEVLDGKAAKKMLFSHKGSVFVVVPQSFMSEADVATLNLMAGMPEFKSVLYYGAIAASPKHGLAHKATVATANHHTTDAASAAALAECNGLRGGGPKCVVVAHITPKKYVEQTFQLSTSATVALRKTYLRGGGPKAFAISPSTGGYATAKGDGAADAALAACNKDGASDCKVVVQD